jgi:SSS family solute:Na+ symporter
MAYMIGIAMRQLMPDVLPDKSYIAAILNYFPVGIRGLLIAGLMASLFSTIDGYLMSSSTLFIEDIYLRFTKKSDDKAVKNVTRLVQAIIIVIVLFLIPVFVKTLTVMEFMQRIAGNFYGVIIAMFLVAVFSKRATAKAATFASITGFLLAVYLDIWTEVSYGYRGVFSFLYSVILTLILSRFEKPVPEKDLENLTIHTIKNKKAPWLGLAVWPNLWKWAIVLFVFWWGATLIWEWYIRI